MRKPRRLAQRAALGRVRPVRADRGLRHRGLRCEGSRYRKYRVGVGQQVGGSAGDEAVAHGSDALDVGHQLIACCEKALRSAAEADTGRRACEDDITGQQGDH
jgi:hypothetical protein